MISVVGQSSPCRAAVAFPQLTEASKIKDSVAVARNFARQDICVCRQLVCGTVTADASGINSTGAQQSAPFSGAVITLKSHTLVTYMMHPLVLTHSLTLQLLCDTGG